MTSSDGKEDEVDPDNPDAKSDISVRGDADDLDDDDDLDSKSNSVKEIIEESNPDSPVFPSLVPEEATVTSTTLEDIPVSTVSASLEESNHDNDNDNNAPQEETTVEVTTKEVEGEEEDVVTSSKFDY